jgi:hypothetical protein
MKHGAGSDLDSSLGAEKLRCKNPLSIANVCLDFNKAGRSKLNIFLEISPIRRSLQGTIIYSEGFEKKIET